MSQMHSPQRVLIVDDERVITDTLVLIFSTKGYEARAAYSAEEALEVLMDWSPDLAVLDVVLPGISGIDLAVRLKAEFPECRLLIFSGHASTTDVLRAADAQGYEFNVVAKPIHPAELLAWADGSQPSASEVVH